MGHTECKKLRVAELSYRIVKEIVLQQHSVFKNCIILSVGVLGTRLWAASMSIGLVILVSKGMKKAERAWLPLMFISWG